MLPIQLSRSDATYLKQLEAIIPPLTNVPIWLHKPVTAKPFDDTTITVARENYSTPMLKEMGENPYQLIRELFREVPKCSCLKLYKTGCRGYRMYLYQRENTLYKADIHSEIRGRRFYMRDGDQIYIQTGFGRDNEAFTMYSEVPLIHVWFGKYRMSFQKLDSALNHPDVLSHLVEWKRGPDGMVATHGPVPIMKIYFGKKDV